MTPQNVLGTRDRVAVLLPTLLQDLAVGDQIFINDGIVELQVIAVEAEDLVCTVRSAGVISSKKGCNIPSTKVNVASRFQGEERGGGGVVGGSSVTVVLSYLRRTLPPCPAPPAPAH